MNVAGRAPIIVRPAGRPVSTIAGLGHWPRSFPADYFMRNFGGEMPDGIHMTVVPAAPDAWITALRDSETMRFGDVASSAIPFARDGFAVYDYLAEQIAENADRYARWDSSAAVFLPGGRPPVDGERFVQADLAGMLQYVADEEAPRGR